jgi:hypothetical protein
MTRLLIAAALAATSLAATADVKLSSYTDSASFVDHLGPFDSNFSYNFDDLNTSAGLLAVKDPGQGVNTWTTHGISYDVSVSNNVRVAGSAFGFGLANNALISDTSNGGFLAGAVSGSGSFNLFGFDLATLEGFGPYPVAITLHTNKAVYQFPDLAVLADAVVAPGKSFYGFSTTDPTEHFTSFSITSSAGAIPALDDVMLGLATVSPVPEPETVSLLIAGLMLLGLASRRRVSKARGD